MTQVQGIPYRRHGPSAALREFLDPLDLGDYFDCGRARLHGLDDALLEEARSRGRAVGDDAFLLVATDSGLVFCRPSISFAIAARWEEISLIRPRGDDPVVLPVTWPRHGELKFTISKRLAGNIFRRWLQLRMHVARRARDGAMRSMSRPLAPASGSDLSVDPGFDHGASTGHDTDLDLDAPVDLDGPVDLDRLADIDVDDEADLGREDERTDDGAETSADREWFDDLDPHADLDPRADFEADRVGGIGDTPERSIAIEVGSDGIRLDGDSLDSIATIEPPRSTPAQTSDDVPLFEPVMAREGSETLVDGELERVSVPRSNSAPPSWVGSAVSLVASLVVISTVVLIATVSISMWRGISGGSGPGSTEEAGPTPTTIDHERFRASSDPVGQLTPADGADGTDLDPSAAGGASQSVPSSSQQLLAAPPDPADPDLALRCSSNYSGCVPDVVDTAGADVDCVGQGDGPYFAETEVMVLGDDIYGLDSDGDRIGCEADQISPQSDGLTPTGDGDGAGS